MAKASVGRKPHELSYGVFDIEGGCLMGLTPHARQGVEKCLVLAGIDPLVTDFSRVIHGQGERGA